MFLTRVLFRFDGVRHYTDSLSDLLADIISSLWQCREKHFALEAKVFARVLEEGRKDGFFRRGGNTVNDKRDSACHKLPIAIPPERERTRKTKELEKKISKIADLIPVGLIKRS